jgi:preprotein translocase subunit SecY
MASAAEQLVSNMNFGALAKATELKQRIWFTLGALVVFRLGTHIPLPGIDPTVMAEIFKQNAGGLLGMVNMFAGGAMERMAIFALGIMPYISASIMIQLFTLVSKELEALKKEGEMGRKKLNQYTRWLTLILAIVQSYGMAVGLEGMAGAGGGMSVVADPGWYFRLSAVITLTGGTLFVLWLAEQITARGVGNGSSMIIFTGIVAGLPMAIASTLELGRTGALSAVLIVGIILMVIAVIAFIVFMERAQRRLIVQYPARQMGNKRTESSSQHLPLKINSANVIPPVFASSLLLLPATVLGFVATDTAPQWLQDITAALQHGQPLFMLVYATLIIFFCFFYTAIVVNPDDTAENLKKYGGIITGIRPGKNTADYIDYVLTRLTVLGAAYLALVCLLPEFIIAQMPGVPFYLGGTSLLIAVSVTIDTIGQIHSHLLAHQYEGLIKKAKLRGTKR